MLQPLAALVVALAVIYGALVMIGTRDDEVSAKCRAAGGEPVKQYRGRPLCVKPGSIIHLEN